MQKQAPTLGRILIMAIFTLSCFGLLLYLWSAFGGPVPLKPRGYQFNASFDEATQLAQEADVRISGVTVGTVKKIELGDDGRTDATIELQDSTRRSRRTPRDPAPEDAARRDLRRADARHEGAPTMPEGGGSRPRASRRRWSSTRSSAPSTRRRARPSRSGSRRSARASRDTAQDFSDALGRLEPFAEDTNEVLKILNSQERATQQAIRNTGVLFEALTERDEQLADLIDELEPPARHDAPARPGDQGVCPRAADLHRRVERRRCARSRPTRRTPSPLLRAAAAGRPSSCPTSSSAQAPVPRLRRVLHRPTACPGVESRDCRRPRGSSTTRATCSCSSTRSCGTSTRSPVPRLYRREIAAMLANDTAVTQATDQIGENRVHYLRLTSPVNPESLATYPQRQGWHRGNPYYKPGAYDQLEGGPARVRPRPVLRERLPDARARRRRACPRSCATASSCTS